MQARDVWRRFRGVSVGGQAGIGCVVLFLLFLPVAYIGKTIQGPRPAPPSAAVAPIAASVVTTPSGSASEAPRPRPPKRTDGFVTKGGFVGARSKEALDKAITYVAQGDKKAFEAIIATGAVFVLPDGMEVVAVDADGIFSGVAKVRKRGTMEEFWTVKEALE